MIHEPETRSSERIYEGRILNLRRDRLELATGKEHLVEVVEHPESVTVVALDDRDRILLVRQHRHPAKQALLETPAGSIDPGEEPRSAANRELAEETGFRAGRLLHLGSFYLAPGWATEFMHAYLATDLQEHVLEPDVDEDLELVWLPLSEWKAMIDRGEVLDCKSIAAWRLAEAQLRTEE